MSVIAYEVRCSQCGLITTVRADDYHECTSLRQQARARQCIHDRDCNGTTSRVETTVPECNPAPEKTKYGSQGLAGGNS